MAQQYKIPQNLDIEDKILGPFTLKQFLYIMVGGISIYILFNIIGTTSLSLFMLISTPIAIAVFALVFIRINERPFIDFFFYFIQFLREPRKKRWEKATKIKTFDVMTKISESEKASQKEMARLAKRGVVSSQLTQMATLLDTRGWSKINESQSGGVTLLMEQKSPLARSVQEEGDLDDMFSDLEGAVEKLKVGTRESGFGDLEERLRSLLG